MLFGCNAGTFGEMETITLMMLEVYIEEESFVSSPVWVKHKKKCLESISNRIQNIHFCLQWLEGLDTGWDKTMLFTFFPKSFQNITKHSCLFVHYLVFIHSSLSQKDNMMKGKKERKINWQH